jgi:hypothetical protein
MDPDPGGPNIGFNNNVPGLKLFDPQSSDQGWCPDQFKNNKFSKK